MKCCSRCNAEKPVSEFGIDKSRPSGVSYWCKACLYEYGRAYKAAQRAKAPKKPKTPRKRSPRPPIEGPKRPKKRDVERHRLAARLYKKRNAARINALNRKRGAQKRKAMPSWANEFFIEEAYDLAKRRTEITGFKWHVDHIVPLVSKHVCGLHVEHNLQVIPAVFNLQKKNRFVIE